jgi:hypothetical protein
MAGTGSEAVAATISIGIAPNRELSLSPITVQKIFLKEL